MNTIREIIIQDFVTRLALITTAGGYATNIGTHVLRARKKIDPSELPAVIIWPGAETPYHKSGALFCVMTVKLEGIALFGTEDPSVIAEKILGDLKKCVLATNWTRTPEYIDGIVYTGGGDSDSPDDGQTTAGAYVSFDVKYQTKLDDPCSQ